MKRKYKKSLYKYIKIIFFLFIALIIIFLLISKSKTDNYQSSSQFGDKKTWALDKIQAPEAWKVSTGKGVKIAIIDSGLNPEDAEVAKKTVGSYLVGGFGREESQEDYIGHGTQTASIIAGPNGVCPDCQIIFLTLDDWVNNISVGSAIHDAMDQGANVINLSVITEGYDKYVQKAITSAWEEGVVIIAAAGNENNSTKLYPAAYDHVFSIAATDQDDTKATFSNYGSWVSAAAPGVDIYTNQINGQTGYSSGTSFAAPIAAGVTGLIWSSKYGTSNESVIKRLCTTADKITRTGRYWKCGRINAARAVGAIR